MNGYTTGPRTPLKRRTYGRHKLLWTVATAVAVELLLSGCASPQKETPPQNETACKLFARSFNYLAVAVNEKDKTLMLDAMKSMPSDLADAFTKASGDVAVSVKDARDLAPALKGNDDDAQTAFFMAAHDVTEKCEADGVKMDMIEWGSGS